LNNSKVIITVLFVLNSIFGFSQMSIDSFFKPSDSLNKSRRNTLICSEATVASIALIGLNQLWYADYPHSNLHSIDDNQEWLQMDKAGHLFSAYHLGTFGANALQWSGCTKKSQLLYGATLGLAFMTTVEVFDGYSSQWGFSWGDMAANTMGTSFFISQELLWKEQRVVPKFSFHTTSFSAVRPQVLGSSFTQQILKDYNGQTYWLSANLHSFFKHSKTPIWLNIAIGFGADGMISGTENFKDSDLYPKYNRTRQFYFSLDADLTKIQTKSHLLKTIFSVFNSIKIPAPTIEISKVTGFRFHYLYI